MSFRTRLSLAQRQTESSRIRLAHPDRCPVICERAPADRVLFEIDRTKYLVPAEMTTGQFMFVIRKRMKMKPERALFLFAGNVVPSTASLITALYDEQHDDDGFLYLLYSGENTFG